MSYLIICYASLQLAARCWTPLCGFQTYLRFAYSVQNVLTCPLVQAPRHYGAASC